MASEKRYYMICVDLEGRSCLVVGGGSVGLEKARGLLDCGARVTVVAPEAVPELVELPVEWLPRPYETSDLDGRFLVIAATSDTDLNRRVYAEAEARSLLCNVADVPELCSFILPAVYRQDPIAIAVSTGGASPALAQRIRRQIAAEIGPEYAELARTLRDLRPWAKERFASYEERRDFFKDLVERALTTQPHHPPKNLPPPHPHRGHVESIPTTHRTDSHHPTPQRGHPPGSPP